MNILKMISLLICISILTDSRTLSSFKIPIRNSLTMNIIDSPIKKLPVTVLSGFLGAGKTTLLRHILQSDHKKRYAIIVNDMSEINVDEKLVQPFVQHQEEKLVELSNGCICCTLREDLLREVASLAKQGRFDHLVIESTGVSEPLPVAETFTFETEEGTSESLLDIAEIDSMVTVVDAVNFLKDLEEAEDLKSKNYHTNENDTRTITDLLVSQIEFASVIVLNKCDLVSEKQIISLKQSIKSLNSEAEIIESTMSNIDIDKIIGSKSFDFDKCQQSAAWIKAINEDPATKVPETEEYGISSFVFRARKPFHPDRLMEFINNYLDENDERSDEGNHIETKKNISSKILRSKGFFWLASRPREQMIWSQAGGLFHISPGGAWWVDTPEEFWPKELEVVKEIRADWDVDERIGDRRQELVFIGTNLDIESLNLCVSKCLLTQSEYEEGFDRWETLNDPFPTLE